MKSSATFSQMMAVSISDLRRGTRDISFDVYLMLGEDNFAHVFSKTSGLDYHRLATYSQKGVQQLYISKHDQGAFEEFIARSAHAIFNDAKTPHEKRIAALINMTDQNMAELFTQVSVSEETARMSQEVVKAFIGLMQERPQSLSLILKLVSHGDYLYYHSIAVSIFSMFIARAAGGIAAGNSQMLELVGLGGFLHDIGHTQLSKDSLHPTGPIAGKAPNAEELSSSQWKEIHDHPELGLKMIEATPNIPDEVRYIVYQHHEQPSGQGYPNRLHGSVIYQPAKIVGIADAFSALISNRPFRPAYAIEDAIELLRSEKGKWDNDLMETVAKVFAKKSPLRKVA